MTTFDNEWTCFSDSPEATRSIGQRLGRSAEPGLVIALVGPLGAGKTQLVRGIAEGLDIADSRLISSPTFVLIQEYAARLAIYHFDAYRLDRPEQFAALGAEEYFEGNGVSVVEWADRVREFIPQDCLEVQFAIHGPTTRQLVLRAIGERSCTVLRRFVASLNLHLA